ncbi:protease I [Rhodococcus rhodochrous J3]|uniref:Type 1 glutamine amidotransferase n=2 Tax=Rhodococcus rhodochrous TaxID=1829 RepID=A0AA46WTP6_RHORH|nr:MULTISPECIES: type 1 glutamine amidotransferase domain-containing protein [Rhodococcus]MBF4480867.1 type 1 glutamine amidotransferase [Rhodococcus rhodochrous]MCB8909808.1 type 1 glutamine amidotransferase [Rhodococcus rhodochrous]MDC3727584.1 type 1 glutamine amidotransferase [Rhodococcus sp. Rp3]MDJ0400024.1 type 1 glutamine amidotransferase domain-containing protein [Rhodococcus rhodochrous]MDO1485205.1 type 1 glutamine amidotransferase [Rhodococcus rhodochrous]
MNSADGARLSGLTVAILATNGVEEVELVEPRKALEDEGATVRLVSIEQGEIQAMEKDVNAAGKYTVDHLVSEVSAGDFDGLVLPGGTTNPDQLRQDDKAVSFVREFVTSGRPVGVICHGPWTLVEADVVRDRTLTSYPSVRTDIRNAGGNVVDQEVVVDRNLVSSRNPGDLPAFCKALIDLFAANPAS